MSRPCRSLALPLLFVLVGAGCGDEQAEAVDPEGAVRFPLLSAAERTTEDGKVAWALEEDDVTVTLQRIAKDDRVLRGRELQQVAEAIVTRFELAEFDAEVTGSECDVAGHDSYCLHGSMTAQGGELVRRGVLVPIDSEFLLIEAIGPRDEQARVYAQARLIQHELEDLQPGGE